MATKRNSTSATAKSVNTKWLNNAMRSIGISTRNVMKDISPNIYEVVSSGANTTRKVSQTLRSGGNGASRVTESLNKNKYVRAANTAYKNALADLASGKLNNTERAEKELERSMFGEDMDSLFNDGDFSFGDMDEGGNTTNIQMVDASSSEAVTSGFASLETRMTKNTEAQMKASKASMDAFVAVSSASLFQTEKIGGEIVAHLSNISNSLNAINQYNNDNMTKFIDASLAFYENIGSRFAPQSKSSTSDDMRNGTSVFNGPDGGFNPSAYKQYVKKQLTTAFGNTSVGQVSGLIDDDMLNMAAANPLGFATEGIIKLLMPKVVTSTIEGVEKSFSAFMPSLLSKVAKFGEDQASGVGGKLKRAFGRAFGIDVERNTKFDKGVSIEKGPVAFDGITKHAITEVITKELREQTAYLKAIANHYGIDTNKVVQNAKVFNYRTGKYDTQQNITNNVIDEVRNSRLRTMKDGRFGEAIQGVTNNTKFSKREQEAMNNIMDEFFLRLEKHGKFIDMQDSSKDGDLGKILSSLSGDKNLVRYFSEYVKRVGQNNKSAAMDANRAIMAANAASNQTMQMIQNDPYYYNLFAADVDDDIDDLILQRQKSLSTPSDRRGRRKATSARRLRSLRREMDIESDALSYSRSDGDAGFFKRMGQSFGDMTTSAGSHLQNSMAAIIHGNGDEAFSQFIDLVTDQVSILAKGIRDNFLIPLKDSVFGTKGEDGYSRDGIFSGVRNTVKDGINMLKWEFNGKAYKDSKGITHEEKEDTVFGNLRKIGATIKDSVMEKLFGSKDNDRGEKVRGIFSSVADTFKSGFDGWTEAIFGSSTEKGIKEEQEKTKKGIIKRISDALPNALTGTVIGAGAGSVSGGLLGMMVGGPIGGAIIGTAAGFASKSERFQNWLFGKKDPETEERQGGFISKNVQNFYNKNKKYLIGGATIGAVKGAVFGGGALGTLVGGPVAGALTGMATGIVLKSNTFQEFLFGSEKSGQKGIVNIVKGLFKGHQKAEDESGKSLGRKAIGMSLIGAGAGALTAGLLSQVGVLGAALTPFGPIGGAIGGLALSIRAQKDNFHEFLFGKEDENGNKKEGILGQFRNMLQANVLNPLKNRMKDFGEEAMFTLKHDILRPIELAVEPIVDAAKSMVQPIIDKVAGTVDKLGGVVRDNLITPIVARVNDYIITPIKTATNAVATIMFKTAKRVVTAPFKLLYKITSPFAQGVAKIASGTMKMIGKGINNFIIKPIHNLFVKPLVGLTKGLFKVISAPFKFIGGVATYFNDKKLNIGGDNFEDIDRTGSGDTTNAERRKFAKEDRKIDLMNLRKNQKERRYRSSNEQMIAKATGYQRFEDTEENRRLAELATGKKINWHKLDAVKGSTSSGSSADGVDIDKIVNAPNQEDMDVETRQLSVLQQILNVLQGKSPKGDEPKERKTTNSNKSNASFQSESNEEPEFDGYDENGRPVYRTSARDIADEIDAAGGVRNYVKGKVTSVAKAGKKKVSDAKEGINSLLSKFHIRGFANGTTNAPGGEAVAVGENGPEIMVPNGGEAIISGQKPIAVYVTGIASAVRSSLGGIWSKAKNTFGINKHTDSSDARRLAAESSDTSVIADMHSMDVDTEENQEQYEDDMNAAIIEKHGRDSRDAAIDKGFTADETKERLRKEKEEERMDDIQATLHEQTDQQKGFSGLWSSIFSKKGLLTGLVLAAIPLVYKLLKNMGGVVSNLLGSIVNAVSHIGDSLSFGLSNGALGDGDSVIDKIGENAEDIGSSVDSLLTGHPIEAANKFVYDENGQIDHQSPARAQFLSKSIAKGTAKLAGIFTKGKTVASATEAGTSILGKASSVLSNSSTLSKGATKLGADSLIDWGINKTKSSAAKISGKVVGTATESAAETVSKNSNKLLSKVISYIKEFASGIAEKVSSKVGEKVGDNIFSKLIDNVCQCVTKHFPTISAKISGILGVTAGLAATGVGLLAKEGTWIVLGALNGATGAARLFRVDSDYVDATMILISTAMGAFAGTTVGSIMDVVNELVTDVLGIDLFTELATLMYNFLAGGDKYDKLVSGQDEFKTSYLNYQTDELTKQYETMKEAGLIGDDVTLDAYIEGAQNGEYGSSYKSFADYNDSEHKTLGSRVLGGLKWIGNGIGGAAKGVGSFLFGSKTTTYSDANGNTYKDNGDGTYQVTSSDGKDIGYVGKDALKGVDLTENVKKKGGLISAPINFIKGVGGAIGGAISGAGDAITKAANYIGKKASDLKTYLFGKTEVGWYDTNGGYYIANGDAFDYYNANGDMISEGVDADSIVAMINTGALTEGDVVTESAVKVKIKEQIDKVGETFSSVIDKAKGLFDNIKETGSSLIENVKENGIFGFKKFFSKKNSEAWFDPNGNYYKLNGSTYDYYNANNDLISSGIPADEVNEKKAAGILTVGKIQEDSEAKKAITDIQSAVKSAWSKAKSTVASGWNTFTKWLTGGSGSGSNGGYGIASLSENDYGALSIAKDAGSASTSSFTSRMTLANKNSSGSTLSSLPSDISGSSSNTSSVTPVKLAGFGGRGFFFKGGRGTRGNIRRGGRGPSGVLFIGDSWTADPYFQSKWSGCQFKAVIGVAANYWIGKTGGASNVSAVSLMLGLNGRSVSDMQTLINEIITNYPNATFIIQRCPHVRSTYSAYGLTGADLNSQIDQFNSQVQSYVSGLGKSNVRWVDTTSCLQDSNGFLKADLANGDYHLNSSGVDTWVPAIENALSGSGTTSSVSSTSTTEVATETVVPKKRTFTEKLTDFFTEMGSRAASGVLTGNYDTDYSSVLGGDGNGHQGGGRGDDKSDKPSMMNGYTYYSQNDTRWKNTPYTQRDGSEPTATMGTSGCGPTAFSMVASDMTGQNITPVETAALARSTGFRDDTGTNWSFMENAASAYGIPSITQYNPSSNFVSNELSNGHPVILSGVDDGSTDKSAYTTAGHYVVAVGQDDNGNILINDPRGREYSKRMPINQVISQTGAAWSFGGRGKNNKPRRFVNRAARKLLGGYGDADKWIAVVQAVKSAIAAKSPGYSQSNYIDITIGGVTKKVRTDCSGMVTAALKFYGVLNDGVSLWTGNMMDDSSPLKSAGFSRRTFTSWDDLNPGDILVRHDSHQHTEVYAGKKDGNYLVYNCGSSSSVNNPGATGRSYDTYSVVWAPGPPGANCVSGLSVSDNGFDTSSSSGATTTTTKLSAVDALSGFFSEVGNRALEGLFTGNFDTDYNSYFNPVTSTGSTSSDSSSISSGTFSGSENAEKFWSYFKNKGIPDVGIAGLMGNIYHESNINPGQAELQLLSKLGISNEQYTKDVDSGAINKETFLHPRGGNTQYGYGLAQWTSPGRKEGLYDLVKQRNVSIADMGAQLDWLWNELNTSYSSVLSNMKTGSSVRSVSDYVLKNFECPADQSASVQETRASTGQGFYDKYKGTNGGSGTGVASIRKRYGLPKLVKEQGGGRGTTTITSNNLSSGKIKDTNGQSISVSKLLTNSTTPQSNSEKYLADVLTVLLQIADNTLSSSQKLDLLKSIGSGSSGANVNIINGGNTNNITTNNSSGSSSTTKRQSRNAILASKIAQGV